MNRWTPEEWREALTKKPERARSAVRPRGWVLRVVLLLGAALLVAMMALLDGGPARRGVRCAAAACLEQGDAGKAVAR